MRPKENWYNLPKEQAGVALVGLAQKYKQQWTARKTRATSLLSLYEGLSLGSFGADSYDDAEPFAFHDDDRDGDGSHGTDLVWNLGASIMDSIDAKLFALDRIKTAFVVSDGGWEAKRSAVLASRFVEGQMGEPQGIFPDAWALWRHGARLTTSVTGGCMVWFWSDPDEGKIVMELDDTLNTFVSTSGLAYDGVDSVGRITYWDPEKLAARYPKFEAQIFSCAESPHEHLQDYFGEDGETPPSEVRRVPLVQGFRMQGPKVKGVQVVAIPGHTLEHRPYNYDYPPYVHFVPMRQLAGFWGKPLLERIVKPLARVNEIVSALDDAERLSPKGAITFNPEHTNPKTLEHVKNVIMIPHNGPMETAPKYDAPAPFHPVVLEWLKMHKEIIYDLIGASEAQVTASREKGLSSGVAIRLVQNLIHERFAPIEQEYSRCVGPETAKQIIRCAQEIQDSSGGFKATWKGAEEGGFLSEIDASVFDVLTKQKYRIEPQSVSGNVNTPADRIQLAEELMQAGIITGEAYGSILEHFDVHGESGSSLSKAEEQFTAQQIDKWLYSEDDDLDAPDFYEGPEKWMNSQARLLQVGAAYLEAKISKAPVERLKFFFTFMSELQAQIEEKEARAAQMAAVSQGQAQPPAAAPPVAA